jgi:hypothetical protein
VVFLAAEDRVEHLQSTEEPEDTELAAEVVVALGLPLGAPVGLLF